MNRCTYTLSGNSVPRLKRRNAEPPEGIPEGMKELYQEQEAERYSLRMQVNIFVGCFCYRNNFTSQILIG